MSLPQLNPVEPPWYGPVCPVVGEGWHREVSPYPDQWHRRDDPFEPADCRFAGTKPTLSRKSKSTAVGKELPIRDVSLSASIRAKRTLNKP
jgi:hypothetical protein